MELADKNYVVLMDLIKTAYALEYHRLLLLIKGGIIGNVVSVNATCTSMRQPTEIDINDESWASLLKWGPTAMLPFFDILGAKYDSKKIGDIKL